MEIYVSKVCTIRPACSESFSGRQSISSKYLFFPRMEHGVHSWESKTSTCFANLKTNQNCEGCFLFSHPPHSFRQDHRGQGLQVVSCTVGGQGVLQVPCPQALYGLQVWTSPLNWSWKQLVEMVQHRSDMIAASNPWQITWLPYFGSAEASRQTTHYSNLTWM